MHELTNTYVNEFVRRQFKIMVTAYFDPLYWCFASCMMMCNRYKMDRYMNGMLIIYVDRYFDKAYIGLEALDRYALLVFDSAL